MKRTRGFTLVEIMVAVTILAVLMTGISEVLILQSRASTNQSFERDLEQNGRLAIMEIARSVRLAGYGIIPTAAFDFDRYGCVTPGTGNTCNPMTVGTTTTNALRDRSDGPDELVVSWRDPSFYRTVTSISGGGPYTVSFSGGGLTAPLYAGRIVQLLCAGADPASYLAVQTTAAIGATQLSLRLVTAADGYYPTAAPADGCFASAGLMLVERVRYYVAADTDGVPALFKERGRGGAEKLFRGIEDLQLSYAIGQPPAGSAFATGGVTPAAAPGCGSTWSFGSCAGVVGTPIETATAPDWRNDAYDSAARYSGNPANIRTVNINVVARSTQASADNRGDGVPAIGNRPARAADNYHRAPFFIAEQPQNLLTRAHFLPLVFANSNVGGG